MSRYLTLMLIILLLFGQVVSAQDGCKTNCGLSTEQIAQYPEPNVRPLVVQDSLLFDRVYRRLAEAVDVYDAPNGNITGTLGMGFNYVTIGNSQDGWTQIGENRWIHSEALSEDVSISRYAGVQLLDEPLPYPMGWLLRHVYPSPEPGVETTDGDAFLYRYTRVNLYASVEVDGFLWYQIGADKWVHQFDVARIAPIERPAEIDTHKWVSVDLYEQVLVAYEGETPVFSTLVSSGLPQWSTNEGLFHVYVRYDRTLMSGAYNQPDFYYLEEVPWTMYFDKDIALHGTYWHDGFGYRQSHGCVNLSITDANWLFEWAADEFDFTVENDLGLTVYVYSSGQYQ